MDLFWILVLIYTVSAVIVVLLLDLEDLLPANGWSPLVQEAALVLLALIPVLNLVLAVAATLQSLLQIPEDGA
jgi:hypothetical protein